MTNHDLFSQIVNGIVGTFKFDQIETYFVILALAGLAFLVLRTTKQARDPDGRLIGDMEFTMKGQKYAGRVFEKEGIIELDELNELEKDTDENAQEVARVFKEYGNDLKYYAVKLMPMKGGTIQSGVALLMTHNSLEDTLWSSGIGSHFDIWRGKIHLRQANPAMQSGWIRREGIVVGGVKYNHLIYYPMLRLDEEYYQKGGKIQVIQNSHATMQLAAWVPQFIKVKAKERTDKVAREQSEKYAEHMGAQAAGTAGELNEISQLEAAPRYDQQNVSERKQALHPLFASIIGIFGTILTFALLRSYNPQGDPLGQLIFGALFGIGGTFAIHALKKK